MNKFHYIDSYLLNPTHPITVNVIGCGGTGSHVLTGLARIHQGLLALGKPGLYVTAFDSDEISASNVGRQMFSPSDIGQNKALCLITRINRFYGTDWGAIPTQFCREALVFADHANITFSCVDTIRSRKEIKKSFLKKDKQAHEHSHQRAIYWMDFGNSRKSGQIVLATVGQVKQPNDGIAKLNDIFTSFEDFGSQKEDVSEPSCSMAEALKKQDLFINSTLAQVGLNLVWTMLHEFRIQHRGAFVNLATLKTNPIPIVDNTALAIAA